MKKMLPDYIKQARDMTKSSKGVPTISKKTYKLAKSWKLNGEPPGAATHPYWMNPRLSRQVCGTIVPDKIRLQREERRLLKIANAEARVLEHKRTRREVSKRLF